MLIGKSTMNISAQKPGRKSTNQHELPELTHCIGCGGEPRPDFGPLSIQLNINFPPKPFTPLY